MTGGLPLLALTHNENLLAPLASLVALAVCRVSVGILRFAQDDRRGHFAQSMKPNLARSFRRYVRSRLDMRAASLWLFLAATIKRAR